VSNSLARTLDLLKRDAKHSCRRIGGREVGIGLFRRGSESMDMAW